MADFDRSTLTARAGTAAAIDEGLRSYMLKVYNYMGIGLVVTGLVAYFSNAAAVSNREVTRQVVHGMERRGIPAFGPIWDS